MLKVNFVSFCRRYCFVVMAFIFLPSFTAQACIDLQIPDTDDYAFYGKALEISAHDGVPLAANLFIPKNTELAPFPAIIFINSWSLDEHEYIVQAKDFAQRGYAVLSYSTRGFGCSGGVVEVASSNDISDLSRMVDYLVSRDDIDAQNIGVSGISYGGGISLIGLAHEPRIKTAVAMSTWSSLLDALYGQQTPRLFWGALLTTSGHLLGNLHPEIQQNFEDLLRNNNIDHIAQWSAERSPLTYVDAINARQAPVFLANNMGDNLFQPNSVIELFRRLQGPKRLELNQGTHASGEGLGLFGFENYTWSHVHSWFDYWLKGEKNVDHGASKVSLLTDIKYIREEYDVLPEFNSAATLQTYYLKPRTLLRRGELAVTPSHASGGGDNVIYSGIDSGASTGIPALSAILDGHFRLPVTLPLGLLNRVNGIAFQSDRLTEEMRIRGIPQIQLNLQSTSENFMLIGYLYDVNPWGVASLITHGPVSVHGHPRNQLVEVDMALSATAYDVAEGHSLALVFDTVDLLYDVPTFLPYALTFDFDGDAAMTLRFPVMH